MLFICYRTRSMMQSCFTSWLMQMLGLNQAMESDWPGYSNGQFPCRDHQLQTGNNFVKNLKTWNIFWFMNTCSCSLYYQTCFKTLSPTIHCLGREKKSESSSHVVPKKGTSFKTILCDLQHENDFTYYFLTTGAWNRTFNEKVTFISFKSYLIFWPI